MAKSKTERQKAAEAAARSKAAAQSAQNAAKAKGPGGGLATPPAKGAGIPAPAAAPPAPVQPAAIDPFWTSDDMDAINAFATDLATKLEGIRFEVGDYDEATKTWKGGNLETDTTYQKTQTETGAKQASSAAQDDAISRGIFRSSIKDATLYDIEAQRSLSTKFLDDKLTSARLSAGTNKQILGTAKTGFDAEMLKRKEANAQGVNATVSSAWAAAQAAWAAANPVAATPSAGAPPIPAFKPPTKGTSTPLPLGSSSASVPKPPNYSTTKSGSTKSTTKKPPTVKYG